MDELATKLFKHFDTLRTDRGNFEEQWQDVADYGLGRRDFTVRSHTPGRRRMTLIFSNVFQTECDNLSATLIGLLFNMATRWAEVAPENREVLEDELAVEWFEDTTIRCLQAFAHPEAEFIPQAHETMSEVVGFGSGGFFTDEHENKPGDIFFSSRPLQELFVSAGPEGRVNTYYRKFPWTARQAVEKWGLEGCGAKVAKAYRDSEYERKFDFIHAVMPREHVNNYALDHRRLPIASYYLSCDDKAILNEGGYHETPYAYPSWSKDTGETSGRGCGINALPDTKMHNRMQRARIVAGEKAVDPPVLVSDDGVISPVRTSPGGINVVRAMPGGMEPIRHLENRMRFDIHEAVFESVKKQIQDAFYHDLHNTEQIAEPRMTVPQVLELAARTTQRIGPQIYRLQSGWAEPVVTRVVGLLERSGKLMERPPSLQGEPLKVDYVSPAARAQMNADYQSVSTVVRTAMELAQADPDVLDLIDLEEAMRVIDRTAGKTGILRQPREVRRIRRLKNEQAEQQQQMEQLQQLAQAAGQAAPALKVMQGGEG